MKVLKHVDTLYLYYACDYNEYIASLAIFSENQKFATAKGYDWYYFGDIARVGIADIHTSILLNHYPIIIQYNATYLLQRDITKDLDLFFSDDRSKFKIKRIDFSQTVQRDYLEKDILNMHPVSPHFQKYSAFFDVSRNIETSYLGKRATGKVFRVYNKTKELSDTKNHIKSQILFSYFGTVDNLLVMELELHRKYLKERCNIDNLAEFDKIIVVVNTLLGSLKFCDINDKNMKNIMNKNYSRIKFFTPFSDFADFTFMPVKRYIKSKSHLVDKIEDLITRYNDRGGTKETITSILYALNNKKGDIIDITYDHYRDEDEIS